MNIDFNAIWNGLVTNGIYDIIKIIFGGILGFLGCKYKNKNITVKNNSEIDNSFKGGSRDVNISKSKIKDSFK